MATGSGKTRVAVRSAEELHASHVLVLVPPRGRARRDTARSAD
ncbi:DEAD/DEAH box helicase family protein [Streptomyces sp. NPDC057293]